MPIQPSGGGRKVIRPLTAVQERAIRRAMLTFVEDDLAGGAARTAPRWCVCCRAQRPGAGFICYNGVDLCNACATNYELAHARGVVQSPEEFLSFESALSVLAPDDG